ncbi:unnamed protein product [Brachionus calyciflorus]|uniref:Plastocyanin-like domain-containing protein n=1 Tax=Brachionus calyciflorus TaxID=104777 RepID=A0A813R5K8_9BILA|nr:unnamed protein product [Brachionus calyciflorus]
MVFLVYSFALIIRDKDDPNINLYDFDLKEHYMILIEWNSNPLQSIYGSYLHSALFGTEHAISINGKGGFREEPNLNVPLETYHVKKGFRYRFRIINSAIQNCIMHLSIDEHNMTLIATDGQPIVPIEIESLEILSGERYDFVLNANKNPSDYWIKVQGKGSCEYNKLFQRAILRYDRYEKMD